jgi:hypothetical protein
MDRYGGSLPTWLHYNPLCGFLVVLRLSLFYSIYMVELLLPCGFDTLENSWVKATISICMLAEYFVAKKR